MKYVWCVFSFYSIRSNDCDYDVLSDIFDSEEKAIAHMKKLEKTNRQDYKSFYLEMMEIK